MKFGAGNSNSTSLLQNRQLILRYHITTMAHAFKALSSLTDFSFFCLKNDCKFHESDAVIVPAERENIKTSYFKVNYKYNYLAIYSHEKLIF